MTARRLGAIAALAAIALHARTVGFGFTELDDRDLVVDDHAFLARPANVLYAFGRAYMHVVDRAHAYYRPLVTASYGIDAQWSGVTPAGYHATNVALHAGATALVFALLRRFALPPVVAFAAALVFAVHPALASAVAWIPGRNDSLLAIFAFTAWLFFSGDCAKSLACYRSGSGGVGRALHLGFFGLALLTKETAAVLPVVWMVQAAIVDRPVRLGRAAVTYLVGWAALVGTLLWLRSALSTEGTRPSPTTFAGNLPLLAASLGKVVFPFNPTVLAVSSDLSPWAGFVASLILAAGAAMVPGVRRRVVVFGILTFSLLLAPVLAVPGTLVLDNRLYLPAFGVLLASGELARAAAFERAEPVASRLFVALSASFAVVLAAVTAGYEGAFRDRRAFAREAVAGSPHSPLAHFCLGQSYQLDGDAGRAMVAYETSLSLAPGEVVHNNIAVLHMAAGRWADAERELRAELAVNPRYARAYANLAIVLRREGRDDESREADKTARELGGT